MDFEAFPTDILFKTSFENSKDYKYKRLSQKLHNCDIMSENFEYSISLVIPTFFNYELKGGCIENVLSGINDSKFIKEVIIIATDGNTHKYQTLEEIIWPKKLIVIYENGRTQRASSRNLGVDKANGDFILFLDDDMILKNWKIVDDILFSLVHEKKKRHSSLQECMFNTQQYGTRVHLIQPLLIGKTKNHKLTIKYYTILWRKENQILVKLFAFQVALV